MKQILVLVTVMMAFAITTHATVWRVNNLPGTDAHFTTLQEAHDAIFQGNPVVQPGDTLYLEASSGTYGNLTATKKLVIIGTGYFNAENPNTQADYNTSKIGTITFSDGSQESIISGCKVTSIVVNTSNIVIERNYIITDASNSHCIILNSSNINNVIIRNNYIHNNNSFTGSSGYYRTGNCITATNDGINNIIIKNNYLSVYSIITSKMALLLGNGFSGIIENNVIFGLVEINNCSFNNNILRQGDFTHSNILFQNNIGNALQFGYTNGNQSEINMDDVFIGTGSTDGKWQLKEGSPAIGAGVNGEDCGMFGGSRPYVLSGIPAIPSIYRLVLDVDNVLQHVEVDMDTKTNE